MIAKGRAGISDKHRPPFSPDLSLPPLPNPAWLPPGSHPALCGVGFSFGLIHTIWTSFSAVFSPITKERSLSCQLGDNV